MSDPARQLWLRLQAVRHTLDELADLPEQLSGKEGIFAWKQGLNDALLEAEGAVESFRQTTASLRKALTVLGKIPAGPFTPAVKVLTRLLTTSIRTLEKATGVLEELLKKVWKSFIPIRSSIDEMQKLAERVSRPCGKARERVEALADLLRDLAGIKDPRLGPVLQQAQQVVTLLERPGQEVAKMDAAWKQAGPTLEKIRGHAAALPKALQGLERVREKLRSLQGAAETISRRIEWALSYLPWWLSVALETVLEWLDGLLQWLMRVTGIEALVQWLANLESLVRPFQQSLGDLLRDLDAVSPRLREMVAPLQLLETRMDFLTLPVEPLIQKLKRLRDEQGVPINRAQYTPEQAEEIVRWLRSQGIRILMVDANPSFSVDNGLPVLRLSTDRSVQAWEEEYFHYLQWRALRMIFAQKEKKLTTRDWKEHVDRVKNPGNRFRGEQEAKLTLLRYRKELKLTTHDHSKLVEDLARYLRVLRPDLWKELNPPLEPKHKRFKKGEKH